MPFLEADDLLPDIRGHRAGVYSSENPAQHVTFLWIDRTILQRELFEHREFFGVYRSVIGKNAQERLLHDRVPRTVRRRHALHPSMIFLIAAGQGPRHGMQAIVSDATLQNREGFVTPRTGGRAVRSGALDCVDLRAGRGARQRHQAAQELVRRSGPGVSHRV